MGMRIIKKGEFPISPFAGRVVVCFKCACVFKIPKNQTIDDTPTNVFTHKNETAITCEVHCPTCGVWITVGDADLRKRLMREASPVGRFDGMLG